MENSSDVQLPAPPDVVETQRKPGRRRTSKQSGASQMSQGSLDPSKASKASKDPSKVQLPSPKEGSATAIDASSFPKARPRNKSNKRTVRGVQGSAESGLSMASSEVQRRTRNVAKTPPEAGASPAVASATSLPTRGPAAPSTPPSGAGAGASARAVGRQPVPTDGHLEFTLLLSQPPDTALEDDTLVMTGSKTKSPVQRARRMRPPRLNQLDPLIEVTSIDTFGSNDSTRKPALKTGNTGGSGGSSGPQRIRFQNSNIFSPPESLMTLVAQGVGRPRPASSSSPTSIATTKQMNTAPRKKEGSIVWVMGPEGSGKTMLCALLRKEITQRSGTGTVEVLHWPMLLRPRGAAAGTGFSAQPPLTDTYAVPDVTIVTALQCALSPMTLQQIDLALLCDFPHNLNQALMFQKLVRTADAIVALCASEEVLLKRTQMAGREELVLQLQERLLDHLKNSEAVLNRFADLVIRVNSEEPLTVMTAKTHRQLLDRGLIPHVVRRR